MSSLVPLIMYSKRLVLLSPSVKVPLLKDSSTVISMINTFKEEISKAVDQKPGIIDQGILLWNIVNHKIIELKEKYPDWILVRQEDISMNPKAEFKEIFNKLTLDFTAEVKIYIESTTAVKDWEYTKYKGHHDFKRDSIRNLELYKKRLSKREREYIIERTKPLLGQLYSFTSDEIII